jgi:hypothetical protein
MAKRIALNRVPAVSDIGHQRDDVRVAEIKAAAKDPRQIKGVIQSGALAP